MLKNLMLRPGLYVDPGRFLVVILLITISVSLVQVAPGSVRIVSAAPTDIAWDMVNATSQNLTSHTNVYAGAFSSAADGFQKYQRGVSASIPFSLLDDSLTFPTDSLGIVKTADLDEFFGATDTVNGDTPIGSNPLSATWEFDISGADSLTGISIDMAAMGDFEDLGDYFLWEISIDGGAYSIVFQSDVDEAINHTYTLEDGDSFTLNDPMTMNGTVLTNEFQTFTQAITGSGTTLTLRLTLQTDGGEEAMAFRDIVIQGTTAGNAAIVPTCPSTISTLVGYAASGSATATDSDGIVNGATISAVTPSDPGTLSLSDFTAAGGVGGTASVDLDVADTTPVGTYTATLEFSNSDPQTATCDVDIEVLGLDLIHDIQGSGSSVTNPGATTAVQGIIVGDYQGDNELRGFYIQEETTDEDADPATSEGIFVYCGSGCIANFTDVNTGDLVSVVGVQEEFANQSQIDVTGGGSITVDTPGAGMGLVTTTAVNLPIPPGATQADFWEPLEGMLVQFAQTLSVTEHYNLGYLGQVMLSVNGRQYQYTQLNPPDPTGLLIGAYADEIARSRILLDDYSTLSNPDPLIHPQPTGLTPTNTLRGGDQTTGLLGIVEEYNGSYRIEPAGTAVWDHANPRSPAPDVGGTLKIASGNVLNYFTTLDDGSCPYTGGCRGADNAFEYDRQHERLVSYLLAIDADIFALMEVENHPTDDTLAALVDGLNAVAGAGTYDYIARTPATLGGDTIKVALIYKSAAVQPLGNSAILDNVYPFDTNTRPPLAQTFQEVSSGEAFTVVVNHFKSKSCSSPTAGNTDIGDGQGCHNQDRIDAVNALMDWLNTDPTGSGDPDVLILGDLNSYAQEDPIVAMKNRGLTNLVEAFNSPLVYSYVFDGQWGYLDYAFANASMATQITDVADWHVNADEPRAYDYNDWNLASFWDGTMPYRAADHDPILVGITPGQTQSPAGSGSEPTLSVFDPSVSKIGELAPGAIGLPGEQLIWTITVTNNGTGTGYDLYVTDTLRSELQIDGVTTERGLSQVDGQTVTFYIPYLDPGEAVQMQIVTTVLNSPPDGIVNNTASLNGVGSDGASVAVSAAGSVPLVTGLPSTGYPPAESRDSQTDSRSNAIWYALIVVLVLGGLYFRLVRR
jgi:uncharacterized repeat protein (TIGR01451 family)